MDQNHAIKMQCDCDFDCAAAISRSIEASGAIEVRVLPGDDKDAALAVAKAAHPDAEAFWVTGNNHQRLDAVYDYLLGLAWDRMVSEENGEPPPDPGKSRRAKSQKRRNV